MSDAETLIQRYRGKGVFLDTNLLVLLSVGQVNPKRIREFKRTQNFDLSDFRILQKLTIQLGKPLVSTPHVLSQVSDLTDLPGRELIAVRELLKSTVETIDEQYDPAKELVEDPLFARFGLGDASVATVCRRSTLVMTADVQMQIALVSSGLDAINFNHVRGLKA